MRSQNTTSPDDIDLASLGRAAKRALPKIAITSLILGGATAAVMTTMAPRFTSTATVAIEPRQLSNPNNPTSPQGSPAIQTVTKEEVATNARNMMSTDLARQMNKALGLTSRPDFNARLPADDLFTSTLQSFGLFKPKPNETDEELVLGAYYKAMKVAQIRETNNIMVELTTSDPKLSADGANKLVQLYRDSLSFTRKDENAEVLARLKGELERLTGEVNAADKRVTDFRSQRDLFQTGAQSTPQKDLQLGELTTELTKVSAARTEAEARSTAAKEQMARGTAESNPDVQKSQIIPRLSEQRIRLERQVSELAATLLPGHPRMRQVQGDLASLQRQIKDEVKKVVDALDKDAKIQIDREQNIKKRISEVKSTITTSAPDNAQLKGLEDAAKGKREEQQRVQKAYEEAETRKTVGAAPIEVKVIQQALPMNEKVWPKPSLFGPLVALAWFLVGLAWAVTRAIVSGPRGSDGGTSGNDSGRIKLEPATFAEPQAIAAAPAIAKAAGAATVAAAAAPLAAAAVAATVVETVDRGGDVSAVVDHLLSREGSPAACRTLIAGDRPGVDAASEAVAVAKALSADGKTVVLVDWAHGGTDLADLTGGATGPGMAQLIQGDAAFEDVIQKLADTDAHFVPAGDALEDPTLVFDADRANLVLDALDESYDHVIVYGGHQAAHDLFEATQGRFDVGVSVNEGAAVANGAGSSFLGFEVADMTVLSLNRRPTAAQTVAQRRMGTSRVPRAAEARA